MSTPYLFDCYAVGVQSLVVRRRRRARATVPNRAAGRLAQRTVGIEFRVVDVFRSGKSSLDRLLDYSLDYFLDYFLDYGMAKT